MKYVIGPDGSALTLADLPAPGTTRWVIRRKAEIVAAVRGGLLSFEEACDRYRLTADEFLDWQRSIDRHGLAGLRTTRIQQYRPGPSDWRRPQTTSPLSGTNARTCAYFCGLVALGLPLNPPQAGAGRSPR